MKLSIRHGTHYRYEPPADRVAIRLRLYPSVFDGQGPSDWSVAVNDEPVEALFTTGYGDRQGLFIAHGGTEAVDIVAAGVVETDDRSGVVRGLPRTPPPGVFRRETRLTQPDDAIRQLAEETARGDGLEEAHALSNAVRDAIDYQPGTTHAGTAAAEALKSGAGVCQDHAHVFISACRARGRPARYVAGYLLHTEDADLSETHGWAEVFIDALGWVGFDPSNRVCPTEHYVRLSCGLDAHDAAPVRGAVLGDATENLHASVAVAPAWSPMQDQGGPV